MNTEDRQAIVDAIGRLELAGADFDVAAAQGLRDLLSASRALLRAKPAVPWGVMLVEETTTRHDVLKFGIIAAVDWEDAEAAADYHWRDRDIHQHVLACDLATFFCRLAKWLVPAAAFDNTLPQVPS